MKIFRLAVALLIFLAVGPVALAQNQNPNTVPPIPVYGNTSVPTYSTSIAAFGNSSAGDVYCISGSATRAVHVKGVRITAVASQAIADDLSLIKRSSADTGGTPTSVVPVPHDSADAAATATVTAYATAPTPGTVAAGTGVMRSQVLSITTATTPALSSGPALFQFSVYWDKPVILHGTAENLCVNVPATSGGQWSIDSEHAEF